MTRPSSSNTRYLELKSGKWRVTVPVPRPLHAKLGTRLKHPLRTDSLAVANRLKWAIVADLKARIDEAQGHVGNVRDQLTAEALELAARRTRAETHAEAEVVDDLVSLRIEDLLGRPIGLQEDPESGQHHEVYEPKRERQAQAFAALASGNATPIDAHHAKFVEQSHNKVRTKADDMRAVRYLTEWCGANGVSPTLQAVTKKVATRFMDGFADVAPGVGPRDAE